MIPNLPELVSLPSPTFSGSTKFYERMTFNDTFWSGHYDPVIRESRTIVDIIRKRAEDNPDKVIYKFLADGIEESDSLNIAELHHQAIIVASRLQQLGKKNDRVVLFFPPGIPYIVSLFGCLYAGMVAVPAYPPRRNRSSYRVFKMFEDAAVSLCLTNNQVMKDIERNFAADYTNRGIKWITYESLQASEAELWVDPEIAADDLALLQYTSGSTGDPKGVMITHGQILYNSEYIRQSFGFTPEIIGMNWLPIYHDMGLIGTIMQAPFVGGLSITMPPMAFLQDPLKWLRAITKYKVTTAGGPNFAFDYCVQKIDESQLEGLDLSSVETFFCGAEPVRQQTLEAFVKKFARVGVRMEQLYPCYGMAETVLIVTGGNKLSPQRFLSVNGKSLQQRKVEKVDPEHAEAMSFTGCGHTWMDTEVRIINPDTYLPCEADEVGEIWICGSGVSQGYWDKNDENLRSFGAVVAGEGNKTYFRSGDLGFMDGDELFITGRIKDLMIFRGVNFYPTDIEFAIQNSHASLRQNAGAAFSVMVSGDERLVIVQEVERSAMHNLPEEQVFSAIRQIVSEEFELAVHAIVLLRPGSIPLTSSGKIQRRVCKYGYLRKELQEISSWSQELISVNMAEVASLVTEENLRLWLVNWVHTKLHIPLDEIDIHKPITSFGLDSLAAVVLENEIWMHFGYYWHISLFMMDTTIAQLAIDGTKIYNEEKDSESNTH